MLPVLRIYLRFCRRGAADTTGGGGGFFGHRCPAPFIGLVKWCGLGVHGDFYLVEELSGCLSDEFLVFIRCICVDWFQLFTMSVCSPEGFRICHY